MNESSSFSTETAFNSETEDNYQENYQYELMYVGEKQSVSENHKNEVNASQKNKFLRKNSKEFQFSSINTDSQEKGKFIDSLNKEANSKAKYSNSPISIEYPPSNIDIERELELLAPPSQNSSPKTLENQNESIETLLTYIDPQNQSVCNFMAKQSFLSCSQIQIHPRLIKSYRCEHLIKENRVKETIIRTYSMGRKEIKYFDETIEVVLGVGGGDEVRLIYWKNGDWKMEERGDGKVWVWSEDLCDLDCYYID